MFWLPPNRLRDFLIMQQNVTQNTQRNESGGFQLAKSISKLKPDAFYLLKRRLRAYAIITHKKLYSATI